MNAITRTLAGLSVLAVASLGNLATAANLACNTDVTVYNDKPASIKVLRFKYKVGGKEFNEGLNNRKIAANGDHETWKNQNLGQVAEGIVVDSIAIDYKNDNSGAGDGYGPSTPSAWFAQNKACDNDLPYVIHIK